MEMFVANATRQRHEFMYSVPEQSKRRVITIEPMSQVRLADNLNKEQIDAIVRQHEPYGFVSVEDVNNSRSAQAFRGLCYSTSGPVRSNKIAALVHQNHSVLEEQGRQNRKEAAIASNDALERTMHNAAESGQIPRDQAAPQRFEATVQHDTKSTDDLGDTKPVSEGWKKGKGSR